MRAVRALGPVAAVAGMLAVAAVLVQRRRLRWITELTNRIPAHHLYWRERGRVREGSVLYVAIGDSAALGIGATSPGGGYVGIVADAIAARTGREVRVRNLSIDGATLDVVLREELPRLAGLEPDVVTLGIGANDVWTFDPRRFREQYERICAALPPQTVVAELPSFSVLPVARLPGRAALPRDRRRRSPGRAPHRGGRPLPPQRPGSRPVGGRLPARRVRRTGGAQRLNGSHHPECATVRVSR